MKIKDLLSAIGSANAIHGIETPPIESFGSALTTEPKEAPKIKPFLSIDEVAEHCSRHQDQFARMVEELLDYLTETDQIDGLKEDFITVANFMIYTIRESRAVSAAHNIIDVLREQMELEDDPLEWIDMQILNGFYAREEQKRQQADNDIDDFLRGRR